MKKGDWSYLVKWEILYSEEECIEKTGDPLIDGPKYEQIAHTTTSKTTIFNCRKFFWTFYFFFYSLIFLSMLFWYYSNLGLFEVFLPKSPFENEKVPPCLR